MRKQSIRLFILLLVIFALPACGGDDGDDGGNNNTGDNDTVAGGGDDDTAGGGLGYVIVTYDGSEDTVQFADLVVAEYDGKEVVTAYKAIMDADVLPVSLMNVSAHFEGSDGFDPSVKDDCNVFLPVSVEDLKKVYIETETNNLVWDDSLNAPGCAFVTELLKIKLVMGGEPKVCDSNATLDVTGKSKADCDQVVGVCENAWTTADTDIFGPCADDPDCCCDLDNPGDIFPGGSYDCEHDACQLDGYCDPNCPSGIDANDCAK